MDILSVFVSAIQILSAVLIILLVLLQQGKGSEAGATFGASGSNSLFGASGSANFLSRSTAISAAVFFTTTILLTYITNHAHSNVMSTFQQHQVVTPHSKHISNIPD